MINLLVRCSLDWQLKAHPPLSKDRVLRSDGDVDQPLRRRFACWGESLFVRVRAAFLIWTDVVLRVTSHFHIRHFLFLDGPMWVWVFMWWSFAYFILVYCNSLLATLNVRRAIRGRAHNDLGISLRPIGDTTIGSKDNRGVCLCVICTSLPSI